MARSATSQHPIGDREERTVHTNGQQWIITWHGPGVVPAGKPHGSAGICVTTDGRVILISADGVRWGLPAGRPEGSEDWKQTLCREVREEACANVQTACLLGFSRGHCIVGHEQGLVLVRALWRADVELQPWKPRHEINHRRLISASELPLQLALDEPGFLPTYLRAMIEAGLD